jgi:Ca-activated chloride channel family protein
MKVDHPNVKALNRSVFVWAAVLVIVGGLLTGARLSAAKSQDARPRQIAQTPTGRPSPTPTPVTPKPSSQPQVNRAATPTPTPASGERRPPTLGDAPPPPRLKPTPTPTPEEVNPNDVLKINTQLVTLNVRVIDRNNMPISNVRITDFHVYEDGVPQPVEFSNRQEVPISYGLAVDASLSLRSQIQSVIDATKTIINSNKRGDETFIERFVSSDKIEQVVEFTDKKDDLIEAVDNFFQEGGQTAVVDGVYLAAEHVADYRKGDDSDHRRRALIVITDGEDRHSFYTEPQLLQRLREEDVQIYVIGFVNELEKEAGFIKKSPQEKAVNLLNKLATETGGRAFFPQSLSEIPGIADEIVRDMRTQYVLSYNPTNTARDGSYRAIRVTVDDGASRDKRIALTRSGRIAPKEGGPAPKTPSKTPDNRTGTARPTNAPTKTP